MNNVIYVNESKTIKHKKISRLILGPEVYDIDILYSDIGSIELKGTNIRSIRIQYSYIGNIKSIIDTKIVIQLLDTYHTLIGTISGKYNQIDLFNSNLCGGSFKSKSFNLCNLSLAQNCNIKTGFIYITGHSTIHSCTIDYKDTNKVLILNNLGSRKDNLIIDKSDNGYICSTGCFKGSIYDFLSKVYYKLEYLKYGDIIASDLDKAISYYYKYIEVIDDFVHKNFNKKELMEYKVFKLYLRLKYNYTKLRYKLKYILKLKEE